MPYAATVQAKAIELGKLVLEMTAEAGSGHPTSALSLAHIVTALMYDHLRQDPREPQHPYADRLVLSEGHACPIVYAAAADLGIAIGADPATRRPMTRADALRLRAIDSEIDGHPNPDEGFPFFPASTGSLGQGLSVAAGMALAARHDGIRKRIYCILGDGESREGQVWEALDFVVEHGLASICAIFNCNGYGQTGPVSRQQAPEALAAKLEAFGVAPTLIDGHDPEDIRDALTLHASRSTGDRPMAIVARTTKGWGVPSMQGGDFHGKAVSGEQLDRAMAELDETANEVGASWTEGDLRLRPIEAAPPAAPAGKQQPSPRTSVGSLRESWGEPFDASSKLSPRQAFGVALRALGHARPEVFVLDGDVGNSTYTETFGNDPALRDRFFQCRIAEQHMVSCAGGLASAGKVAFAASFGKFLARAYDQLEMALLSGFPLKIIGSHVGVSLGADGPSQMALTDAAYFASLSTVQDRSGRPAMHVLTPSDAISTHALTIAMAEHPGACYLRTMRPSVPLIYDEDAAFAVGGHHVLAEGSDLMLAAWGYMVHEAKRAAAELARQGVRVTLVDLYSIPFDEQEISRLAAGCGNRVLVAEDNYGAGLGAAVANALARFAAGRATVEPMSVRRFPKSGRDPAEVLEHVGLAARQIIAAARRLAGA